MNVYKKILIIIISFSLINSVESNIRHSYSKMYLKNIKKSFINICNNYALNQTNNYDIYNCLINHNNNDDCKNLNNYNDFIIIRNDCIKHHKGSFGMVIFMTLISWCLIGFCCNSY